MNFGYNTVNALTSNESNNTVGIGSQAFGGPGYRNNGLVSGLSDSLVGYRAGTPGLIWQEKLQQNVNRMIGAANLNWRPTSWLQTRANFGTDFTDRNDTHLHMNGEGWPLTATYRDGFARQRTHEHHQPLAPTSAPRRTTIRRDSTGWPSRRRSARSTSTRVSTRTRPTARRCRPARRTAGAGLDAGRQRRLHDSEDVGHRSSRSRPRCATVCSSPARVRSDQNSAFGTNFQRVFYPKASLSWQISDEDFFPHGNVFSHVNSLHLRLARGASGVQPGPNDALQTFSAGSASIKATDAPTETYNQIGNDSLRPERSTEWETGFDSRLFGNRVQFDVTYYSKLTKDALISAIIAPSLGSGATQPAREPRLGQERRLGSDARRTVGRSSRSSAWTSTSARRSTRTRSSASARRRRRSASRTGSSRAIRFAASGRSRSPAGTTRTTTAS